MTKNEKLFFTAEITALWPDSFPQGRIIKEEFRHITLSFLGITDREAVLKNIEKLPHPTWKIGPCGLLHEWVFLPEKTPRVVAATALFFHGEETFLSYQKTLSQWLFDQQFLKSIESHFLPHTSVSRDPFDREAWMNFPCSIPFFIRGIALWKSLGHSTYELVWQQNALPPFEEVEHTADIAYKIFGENYSELALHALLALAFSFPVFSQYFAVIPSCSSICEVINLLNRWVAEVDIQEGIGLKAISYHVDIAKREKGLLEWMMIIDV